jgi:DDE superfamily endonuclease
LLRVVVLDNLPAHKVAGVKEAITGRGATLMDLPPYSPDLNPIEQLFRQAQGAAAQSGGSHPGRLVGLHRKSARRIHAARMPELH